MTDLTFGEWLKRRRGALGLTQEQLARQVGCSTIALRKIEAEERRPSLQIAGRLADVLGVETQDRSAFLRFTRGDWQAAPPASRAAPPWQTPRSNLPAPLTSFIGREKEIAEIKHQLATTRLLTLTGSGGTGKTRLALQVAAEVLADYADGVWLIDLAPLTDSALIPQTIAAVFELREQRNRSSRTLITDYLRTKHLLLMLDNCEHLIDGCAALADHLLRVAARLTILATSREALGIVGEFIYHVPSLALPPSDPTPDGLAQCEAAQLFIERATAVARFALTSSNAAAVAHICQRLDGIPLAIELAAARVNVLAAEQIAARLDDRFRLLTGGNRTAVPRQQTLRALMDWSYDLLSKPEQVLLRELSVFADGWTFEAAEAVCASVANILGLLPRLVDKSLVVVEEHDGQARYKLLETVRQYAHDRLSESGEVASLRLRHLAYFLQYIEAAELKLKGPEMIACLDQLAVEQANVRAALQWALENDPLSALRLVAVLSYFWARRGNLTEGRTWIQAVLARADADPPTDSEAVRVYLAARARALLAASILAQNWGDTLIARTTAEDSIALARQINAPRTLAYALSMNATICGYLGEVAIARACAAESLALCHEHDYRYELALTTGTPMFLALVANEPVPPDLPEETLRAARASGNPWVIAMTALNLARLAARDDNWSGAYAGLEEAATLFQQLRDRFMSNASRSEMGHCLRKQGRYTEALAIYGETIRVFQEAGAVAAVAHELECFGFIAGAQGQGPRAGRLLGAAEVLRETNRLPMSSMERVEYDEAVSQLQTQMSTTDFATGWAAGRAMTMDQAIDLALHEMN